VYDDPFYTDLPQNTSHVPAGSIIKIEEFTNTSTYTIAPTLALSRIIFQSKDLNGSLVPVSAFVLWPYAPRYGQTTAPLVTWAHGTSGIFPECGPSHIRNLWYQFSAPFTLALAGFAVVAPDYAGLGVPYYANGSSITHQYVAAPAAGNDLLFAAEAAMAAFPDKLTENFAVMGHSQGGGAAWGAAQQQLEVKAPGYLGTIAGSPVTNTTAMALALPATSPSISPLRLVKSLESVFPEVSLSDLLTPEGINALDLYEAAQGCTGVESEIADSIFAMNSSAVLWKDAFFVSSFAQSFGELTIPGGKDFAEPLLIVQGLADQTVPASVTTEVVEKTCAKFPHKEIQYIKAEGVDHVPVMYATQQIWLKWLDERFTSTTNKRCDGGDCEGGATEGKCCSQTIGSTAPRPVKDYSGNLNYFLEYALDAYETA
jgi:pimeloyl-ACP methyl ester carboxylesterase